MEHARLLDVMFVAIYHVTVAVPEYKTHLFASFMEECHRIIRGQYASTAADARSLLDSLHLRSVSASCECAVLSRQYGVLLLDRSFY